MANMMLLATALALGALVPLAAGDTATASAYATNAFSKGSMNETGSARATESASAVINHNILMGSMPTDARLASAMHSHHA